jgi:GntR family transcriptional regulator / MocR family aminotransferase
VKHLGVAITPEGAALRRRYRPVVIAAAERSRRATGRAVSITAPTRAKPAGYPAWLTNRPKTVAHLPAAANEQTVVAAARERRVGLYGMGDYRAARQAGPPQLVLGFGQVGERAIEPGIAAVADLLG